MILTRMRNAGTVQNDVALDHSELADTLFHSLNENIDQCEYFALDDHDYCFGSNSSFLCVHLNISSLQAHFDELKELLFKFPIPPSIIALSETRINLISSVNLNIILFLLPLPPKPGVLVHVYPKIFTFPKTKIYACRLKDVKIYGSMSNFEITKRYTPLVLSLGIQLTIPKHLFLHL